jgi:type IV pilus assembly protein PilC
METQTEAATVVPPQTEESMILSDAVSILDIGEEIEAGTGPQKARQSIKEYLDEKLEKFTAIKTRDKVSFFRLLAIMIAAGVPLVKSLYVLSNQTKNIRMKKIVATMAQKVEAGKTFSEAMEDFSDVFSDAQTGMVRAGEAGGMLNDILKQIAEQSEKSEALVGKVKGAMIYPIVVFTMMGGAIIVILTMVLPKIMDLFTQTDSELPLSTRSMLAVSDFLRFNAISLFIAAIIFVVAFNVWKKTKAGKYMWHNAVLHVPIFGLMLRYVALSRFTRTLSSLMSSGIPIVKSLQIDADAVGNEVYRKRIYLAAEDVSRGIPLAENLTDSKFLFPEMVVSMMDIGEQTAELSKVAGKIADYYDEQVDQMASNMSKLMEPIIMAVMGIVVGGLMVSVMQPIFGLLDVVGNV